MYLAQTRLRESVVLLREGRWTGAHYLSGYIVECGLKAVIASNQENKLLPPDLQTHDLTKLMLHAKPYLDQEATTSLSRLPQWTHLLRYATDSADPAAAFRFNEGAKEALRCLSMLT
jgi:hypothetical protein